MKYEGYVWLLKENRIDQIKFTKDFKYLYFKMSMLHHTDITAVKLYEECILVGIGSWMKVFDRKSAKLMHKIHVLNGQKVYGFIPRNHEILVFGGKQFTVVTRHDDHSFVKSFEAIICNDWLHSGAWIADGQVALLTAHNVVQKWDVVNRSLVAQYSSKENSILYSGLLLPLQDDILVFCGTVFSQVLIHRCGSDTVLHKLKGHKGVIFSVSCSLEKGVIVTTSDDRSVRIWKLNSTAHSVPDSSDYWENVNIVCVQELYGHLARVMRNCIRDDFIISVGEDSNICFWSYNGNLLRKVTTHHNSCIWSLDADNESLVTGGGDSSIILHPLSVVTQYGENEVMDIETTNVKKVVFTARRNVIVLNEKDELVYYDTTTKAVTTFNLEHDSTYKLLSVSSCKQIIAAVDMQGNLDVFIESCKGPPRLYNAIHEKLHIGKVLFMQWAGNRHLVFSCENGVITILASRDRTTEIYASYVLPPCKERWLTSAAINGNNNMLVAGDRCGNLHVYVMGQKNPLKSFKKVHGRYGPTSIIIRKNEIVTTGRDGRVKYFRVDENCDVGLLCSQNFEFQWVEKFVDKNEHYICGFHERVFVVYDVRNNSKVLEVPCGGGHRSWDIVRYIDRVDATYEEFIKLMYLKNCTINVETFNMSNIVSRNIVNGTHSKEINCLKTYICGGDTFLISGGEDTSLRISRVSANFETFQDEAIFKQLSSVRALKLCKIADAKVLAISAGGRAQISIKLMHFVENDDKIDVKIEELCDYLIKGTDKERKGNQTWRNCTVDIDPETRVMDLDIFETDENNSIIVAGCSDAFLRVFKFKYNDNNPVLKPVRELKYHDTCVLKTHVLELQNKKILISCTTRGVVTFWEISNVDDTEKMDVKPFKSLSIHQSGINSVACTVITDSTILLASGGDDNAIQLNLIQIADLETAVKQNWMSNKLHCSQVTGLVFVDDYIVSASIDQRVSLLQWKVAEGITCEFISQSFSDVADIQGLDVLKHDSGSVTVCVFGKGFEILSMEKSPKH